MKAFISYSHDSPEHADRVRQLSDRLRGEGVDCAIDQYDPAPSEGWPVWMERQLDAADFVLIVCTETYQRRADGHEVPGVGRGVSWEANLVRNALYDSAFDAAKFIPVLFAPADEQYIPKPLRGAAFYLIDALRGYESLYRRLTAQPEVVKPALGSLRPMAPRLVGSSAPNSAQTGATAVDDEAVVCLRIAGTPCLYQAIPGATLIRVGRQRRKPGAGLDQGNEFVIRSSLSDDETLKISRQHFEIRREGALHAIIDRSSTGTKLNGRLLTKGQPVPLSAGDTICVSEVLSLEVLMTSAAVRRPSVVGQDIEVQTTRGPDLLLQASIGDMVTEED